MASLYKTNRIVLCMTDFRNHIHFINQSVINGNLNKNYCCRYNHK